MGLLRNDRVWIVKANSHSNEYRGIERTSLTGRELCWIGVQKNVRLGWVGRQRREDSGFTYYKPSTVLLALTFNAPNNLIR